MSDLEELELLKDRMSSSLPKDSYLDNKSSPSTPFSIRKFSGSNRFPSSPQTRRSFIRSPSSPNQSFLSISDPLPTSDIRSTIAKSISGSNSDLSISSVDGISPAGTNQRRRTPSMSSETGLTGVGSYPSLSRSSSTLSLCSNVSSKLSPIDSIIKHVRDRISSSLFSGWYTERRYLEPIHRYRDVVIVDKVEAAVIKQVKYIVKKAGKILPENSFIGVSIDEECKLYVGLGQGLLTGQASHAFGRYWFQIRSITFVQNIGFCLDICVVRPFDNSDTDSCWQCRQRAINEATAPPVKIDSLEAAFSDMKSRMGGILNDILMSTGGPSVWLEGARAQLSVGSIVGLVKFICVLFLAVLTGIWSGLKQLANFLLKILHELAFLVDKSTPFALGALNLFSKLVGGFYLLVAMVWRDFRKPKMPSPSSQTAKLYNQTPLKSLLPPRTNPPNPVPRQRNINPTDSVSAMDNMYSQGRQW